MKLVGIDFGSKRIGIAISDENAEMAFPRAVFPNEKGILDKIINFCKEEEVKEIVIGESRDNDGKDNKIMEKITPFAKELEESGLKVNFHPEFMTTIQAGRLQGKGDMIDASAATIILQSFLDLRKNMR